VDKTPLVRFAVDSLWTRCPAHNKSTSNRTNEVRVCMKLREFRHTLKIELPRQYFADIINVQRSFEGITEQPRLTQL